MNAGNDDSKWDFGGIVAAWNQLRERTRIGVISSEKEYDYMVKFMDGLFDKIGDDENHKLAGLLDVVGALVARYEEDSVRLPDVSPQETLKFLMEQHGLRQADLKDELGSQGIVSEILSGKREINARQAKALAVRFNVSPASFL